jgi:WD40 repeat protein
VSKPVLVEDCQVFEHVAAVPAVLSVEGRRIATVRPDGVPVLWDMVARRQMNELTGHEGAVHDLAFSRDGTLVATACDDGTARIWDAVSNRETLAYPGHEGRVLLARFDPDRHEMVTVGADGDAHVWELAAGRARVAIDGRGAPLEKAIVCAGRLATIGHDGMLAVHDLDARKTLFTLAGDVDQIADAALARDGARLVIIGKDCARVLDGASGRELAVLSGHGGIHHAAFSHDGWCIVTAGADGTARVWDAVTGSAISILSGHVGPVHDAAFSPDGDCVVTAGADRTARVWDAICGVEMATLCGHRGAVRSAAFGLDGKRIVTTGADGTARVWVDATQQAWRRALRDQGQVDYAVFGADGRHFATLNQTEGTMRIRDAITGRAAIELHGSAGGMSVRFSPDGARVATSVCDDGMVRIWDVGSGHEVVALRHEPGRTRPMVFSPDGARIAILRLGDDVVRVWDTTRGVELAKLAGHGGEACGGCFSRDGQRFVTVGRDGIAHAWDGASWRETFRWGSPQDTVGHVEFSPDDSRLVTCTNFGISTTWKIRDAASSDVIVSLGAATSMRYSPDGSRILVVARGRVAVLEPYAGGEILAVGNFLSMIVDHADFSLDGTRIVVYSGGWAYVFDAQSGRKIEQLSLGADFGSFFPRGEGIERNGARIVARSNDAGVRLRAYPALYAATRFGRLPEDVATVAQKGLVRRRGVIDISRPGRPYPAPPPAPVPRPDGDVVVAPAAGRSVAGASVTQGVVYGRPPGPAQGTSVVPPPPPAPEPTSSIASSSIAWPEPRPADGWERESGQIIVSGLNGVVGVLRSGLQVPIKTGGQIDTDHVLVSEVGLFVVECKSYGGRIVGTLNGPWSNETPDGAKRIDAARRINPAMQVREQVYALKNILTLKLGQDDDLVKRDKLWVDGIVLFRDMAEFALDNVPVDAFDLNAPVVFTPGRFVEAVRERMGKGPPHRFSHDDVGRIAAVLQKI